jgi:hypothetical protein
MLRFSRLFTCSKSIIAPEEFYCRGEENESEQLAWYIWLDVYCLDYDGNVLDTALIATIGALENRMLERNCR